MANKQTNGKDPAVLLYTQDFIVGTLTMTDEQRGKYILLLCLQHQKENKLTLTDLQIAGGDEVVLDRFPLHEDGYYYNDRMAMEIENRRLFTESRRANGIKGGRPKKTEEKPNGFNMVNLKETYDKPNSNLNQTYNKPTNNLAEDENEIENVIVNEVEAEVEADTFTFTDKLRNLIDSKILDVIIDSDVDTDSKIWKDMIYNYNELGGFTKISEIMEWDDSIKLNWKRKFINYGLN
jgi:uncharacterized protein YdaU (DUF1376 family)